MMGIEKLTFEQELERRRKIAARATKHGHRVAPKGSPEYRTWVVWCSMRARCTNPRSKDYANYGARGITVCESWSDYYENFVRDMGLAPYGFSIDRIDNSKGYCKENCRWASKKQQARNRRSNHILVIGGVGRTLAEWAEVTGIRSSTIRMRIEYNRGKVDESILQPVND